MPSLRDDFLINLHIKDYFSRRWAPLKSIVYRQENLPRTSLVSLSTLVEYQKNNPLSCFVCFLSELENPFFRYFLSFLVALFSDGTSGSLTLLFTFQGFEHTTRGEWLPFFSFPSHTSLNPANLINLMIQREGCLITVSLFKHFRLESYSIACNFCLKSSL